MYDEQRFYEREWLNEEHGRAYVISKISSYEREKKDEQKFGAYPEIEGYFEVADCENKSRLDFSCADVTNQKDFDKCIRKIERFDRMWKKFRQQLKKIMMKKKEYCEKLKKTIE